MMTLNQLRILIAISKQKHLTDAAQDLCLMQPLSSVELALKELSSLRRKPHVGISHTVANRSLSNQSEVYEL